MLSLCSYLHIDIYVDFDFDNTFHGIFITKEGPGTFELLIQKSI